MYTEGKGGIYYMFNQAVTEFTPSFLVRDEGFGWGAEEMGERKSTRTGKTARWHSSLLQALYGKW